MSWNIIGTCGSPVGIKFCGHACIFVETDRCTIAIDPWFSKSGALLASWYQFPDNTDLDLEPIRNADYILVTHEHQDHLDLNFLKSLRPHTKVIIPRYTDRYLYESIRKNIANEILLANGRERIQLSSDLTICLFPQTIPIWDDCTVILETPEGTLLNVNDMKITSTDLQWIRENFQVDYLYMQFAPSAWHPYVYDFTDEKKIRLIRHKTITRFNYAKDVFLDSGAKKFIPGAGPPCFLDRGLLEATLMEECVFKALPEFYEFAKCEGFADRLCLQLPGDTLQHGIDYSKINERVLQSEPYSDTRNYLLKYRERRESIISDVLNAVEDPRESLLALCKKHFEHLIRSTPYLCEKISGSLLLDLFGPVNERILIDFSKPMDAVQMYSGESYQWKLRIRSGFLNLILQNQLTWEELFLSRRFEASREPDVYNEFLIVFLRFQDVNSYHAFEKWEKTRTELETFDLAYDGVQYRIQRYCPHARGDLSKGRILNGEIVCPGHGWTFSLENGSCMNGCRIQIERFI